MQKKGFKVKVSIIVPVFNCEKFIGQAIQSVLEQTFEDFEFIIIDDGSLDNTVGIILQFKDLRIRLIKHEENRGVCEARNTGLQEAKGEWIAPIDADDTWHKERLKKLLKVAEQNPNTFVGSDVMICISGKNNELIPWKTFFQDRKLKPDYLFFPKPADLVKYGLDTKPLIPIEAVRKFDLNFRQEFSNHDWQYFLLRLYGIGLKYIIINEPLYNYRLTPGGLSTSYSCVRNQLKACAYFQSVDWVDQETRRLIKKDAKISKYRLFTIAIREKHWIKALKHAVQSPLSIWYLLRRLPTWTSQKKELKRILKKA